MFGLGTPEIIIIVIVILVLFGAKKIPEFMQGIGKGMREFKKATGDIEKDLNGNNTNTDLDKLKNGISFHDFNKQMYEFKKLYDEKVYDQSEFSEHKRNLIAQIVKNGTVEPQSSFLLGISSLIKDNVITEDEMKLIKTSLK